MLGMQLLRAGPAKRSWPALLRTGAMLTDGECSVWFERFDYVWVYEIERPILAAPIKHIQKIEQVLHSVQEGIQPSGLSLATPE